LSIEQHHLVQRLQEDFLMGINKDTIRLECFHVGSPEFNGVEEWWRQGKYRILVIILDFYLLQNYKIQSRYCKISDEVYELMLSSIFVVNDSIIVLVLSSGVHLLLLALFTPPCTCMTSSINDRSRKVSITRCSHFQRVQTSIPKRRYWASTWCKKTNHFKEIW